RRTGSVGRGSVLAGAGRPNGTSLRDQAAHVLLGLPIGMRCRVRAAWPAMMEHAEPAEVLIRLDPGADRGRIREAREVPLQRGQVDALLEAELDVGVMEFQAWLLALGRGRAGVALGVAAVVVADPLADVAAGSRPVLAVVVVEVHVVRIVLARRVRRE